MQTNRVVHASRWHPQSTLTHEAGLAVAKVGGDEEFWKFSDALFECQEVHHVTPILVPSKRRHYLVIVPFAGLL